MKKFRIIIILFVELLAVLSLQFLIYGTDFNKTNTSNSFFVIGMISLMPSIIAITNAYVVFQGINYSLRALFSPRFKAQYSTFREYKEEKAMGEKSTFFRDMLVSSLIIVFIGIVLGV